MATKRTPPIKRLLVAIESGDIKLVERLVAKGANVNGELWSETPASCAIRRNQLQILALLLRHGLDLRHGEDYLFCLAACNNRRDILNLLATMAFTPDLWRGKSRAEIEQEADLIYPQH
jgi:ankyrin repeat protein